MCETCVIRDRSITNNTIFYLVTICKDVSIISDGRKVSARKILKETTQVLNIFRPPATRDLKTFAPCASIVSLGLWRAARHLSLWRTPVLNRPLFMFHVEAEERANWKGIKTRWCSDDRKIETSFPKIRSKVGWGFSPNSCALVDTLTREECISRNTIL